MKYGKAVKVEESTCMIKKGQTKGKKRCTYQCDHPNGCMHEDKIQKGTFYGLEECNALDKKIDPWTYIPAGPYLGNDNYVSTRSREKTETLELFDPTDCRVCLSTKTGHPMAFNSDQIGFTGILAKTVGKVSPPDLKISTRYENDERELEKINSLLEEKKSATMLIDGVPYVLQPCRKKGDISFLYFQLISDSYSLQIKNNQLIATTDKNSNSVYFTLENVIRKNRQIIGNLVCYNNMHEQGWLDQKTKWHPGLIPAISVDNVLTVVIHNKKIMNINGNKIFVPINYDSKVSIIEFNLEPISNISVFLKDRKNETSTSPIKIKEETKTKTFFDLLAES